MFKHAEFLNLVRNYVEENPDVSPHVTTYVAEGLKTALDVARDRAFDMETAAIGALQYTDEFARGAQGIDYLTKLITDKMMNWENKTCCNWEYVKHLLENLNGD